MGKCYPDPSWLEHEPHAWKISNVRKLVIYCLGTLENPVEQNTPYKDNSLYQLAFSGILRDMMPNLEGPPEFYDPGFNEIDKAVLEHLGYTVCFCCLDPMSSSRIRTPPLVNM